MKHIKRIAFAVLAVLVTTLYAVPVHPAAADANDGSSSALSIVPKKNYVIEPGKSVDDKLTIRNADTSASLNLSLKVIDFTYDEQQDSGVAKLFLDTNAEQTPWSLRPHISIPKSVTIGPGETKTVDMTVSIPANQGAGSLYSAIVYSSGSGGADNSTNIGLSASGVTLVFTDVPGKAHEALSLEKVGPYDKVTDRYMPYISTAMPQSIGYSLKDSGNWVEAPIGSITVNGWFGRKTVIENVNPTKSVVLIGQTRTFSSCIKFDEKEVAEARSNSPATTCVDPGLWPGYYSVTADLYYGANGNQTQEIIKTGGFWYLPWWFLAIVLAILLYVGYHGWKLYRRFKGGGSTRPTKMKKLSRRR